jgi:hypothetical protein
MYCDAIRANSVQSLQYTYQNDNGGNETDTETSNETASNHDAEASGSSLEDTSNAEDGASSDNGHTTTDEIGKVTSNDSTEESTSGQDRCNQRRLRGGNTEELIAVLLDLEVIIGLARELDPGVVVASVLLDEVVHVKNTSHPASVISEEDTSERRECDDQVGTNSDRCLDTVDVGGTREGSNSTSRHCD